MKSTLLAFTAAILASLAPAAHAELVTWDLRGKISDVGDTSPYQAGDSFQTLLTFDTAAADLTPSNPNRHSLDIASLKISHLVGNGNWRTLDASSGGFIYVRDNQPNPADPTGPMIDGLTFSLGSVSVILRWADVASIDYSQGLLPSSPPALTNMVANQFQEFTTGFAIGPIDSISAVPEPESYALMLLGLGTLIGATASRRSRPQA